eukprot:TRINITY_DN11002_c0_g1_i1.p1 TRINITY_DN11002_c0_g1~~TRINITY_DN11002_c0_g1_i1.p1  ORF type:complete len:120 (-),score=58.87 TRINITY_DN11002_c0_g1_i1:137-496(-)
MAYVTTDELAAAPRYMVNRLTIDRVNEVIDVLQAFLAEKYRLLQVPRAKVPHRELKRWQGFLDDEAPGTKGLHFCTDANLKALPGLKLDQAGRNTLTLLRHLGRLRELRAGATVRYAVA